MTLSALTVSVLPAAIFLGPAVVLASAFQRVFAEPKHTWASILNSLLHFVLGFLPQPCFENMFSEMTFIAIGVASILFVYQFFPEVMLNDFVFMHFLALFSVTLLPLAFSFMPLMNSRNYLTLVH